jgi:restriction system protein
MTLPKLYEITLPLLQILKDEIPRTRKETTELVCEYFKLTEDERKQLKPSGGQTLIDNRTGWARLELKHAGLIERLGDKTIKITSSGKEILQKNPGQINRKYLMGIPIYFEYFNKLKTDDEENTISLTLDENASSEDLINSSYQKYKQELELEILDKVKENTPDFFEQLVVNLIEKMGYGRGTVTGKSGDGGIDGLIDEDKLGLSQIFLQAKRWKGTVPGKEIRDFAGMLDSKKSKKGIFITTSDYSNDAKEFVKTTSSKIILINGKKLAELMFEYDVGFSSGVKMELKTINEDYFS